MMKFFITLWFIATTAFALPEDSPARTYQDRSQKEVGCDLCLAIVTEIDNILASEPTLEAAIEAIDGICPILGDLLAPYCHHFIEQYLPQVIEYLIEHQLAPNAVCEALSLCDPVARNFSKLFTKH